MKVYKRISKIRSNIFLSLFIVVILEMGIIGYTIVNRAHEITALPQSGIDIKKTRKELVRSMQSLGLESAYAHFIRAYSKDTGNQHTVSHLFGELLYDQSGIEGLTVCDNTFAYGCYHGFFGRAISRQGIAIVPKLDEACRTKKTEDIGGCQHGVGHGILTYLGDSRLIEALESCRSVAFNGSSRGCLSGVFMEYNLHTMDDPSGRTSRPLKEGNPFEPCDRISEDFKSACFYELPQWWEKVFDGNYKTINLHCDSIQNSTYRSHCFRGVGNIVKFVTNYDVGRALRLCAMTEAIDGELLCRSEAYQSFSASDASYRQKGDMFCTGLSDNTYTQCISNTKGTL